MSRTLEQKIADAEARLQRLKAKSRSLDTAQKVIVGAALLAKVRKPEEVQLRAWLLQFLKAEVTRQADVFIGFLFSALQVIHRLAVKFLDLVFNTCF
ncbi:mobilization protein (plasmid) [Escherichia coli]|nr:mobilization protein [Escherichia coli]